MALATKCPHCGALFRVVADQLKLRGGLVRCGQCRTVFDAIGSLTYVDDGTMTQTRPMNAPAPATPAAVAEAEAARTAVQRSRQRTPQPVTERPLSPATTLRIAPGVAPVVADAPTPAPAPEPAEEEGAGGVPTLLAPELLRDKVEEAETAATEPVRIAEPVVPAETEEPAFIRSARRAPRRGFSIVFGGGSLLLALVAAVQLAIIFRTDLMTRWPELRPALARLCDTFGCTIGWPARPAQLAVMGSELQAIPGTDVLELSAVVRNRASFTQALPALEVTLTDSRNRAIARKVFSAADYLAATGEARTRIDEGLAAGTDLTIRVYFEARGLQPAGFLVYPFHL